MKFKILFLVIASILISSCSSSDKPSSAEEYMEIANKNIDQEKYYDALLHYKGLVENYPQSNLIPKASFELGKLYHGQVDKNISTQKSYQNAVKFYKKVYTEFPEFEGSERAMFMAGFLLANELNDYEEAKEIYSQFIKNYPESELVTSVKSELDNLGMEPDEILKMKKGESE